MLRPCLGHRAGGVYGLGDSFGLGWIFLRPNFCSWLKCIVIVKPSSGGSVGHGGKACIRGTVTHTTLAGKLIPEVSSLILHVVHLDFMLVKHGAVIPPYRSENTAFSPYFHIPCVSIHKNSQDILRHPSASR